MNPFHSQGLRVLAAIALLAIASAVTAPPIYGQRITASLFRDAAPTLPAPAAEAHAMRSRHVMVDVAQIRTVARVRTSADVAHRLLLNLFPDATVEAILDRVDTPVSGFVWVGHVPGVPQSSVTLAVEGEVVAGSVVTPGATFTIRSTGITHIVSQVDQASYPSELPPLVPTRGGRQAIAGESVSAGTAAYDAQSDDGSTIDVMVLYTAAVSADRGGDAGARALVNLGISETNTSYANSGITQRLRLVYTGQIAYTESPSGDMGADLDNVTNDPSVATLRNTYGADLVSLWVHYPAAQYCGIAWVMSGISTSFAPDAFSTVEDDCVSPNYSFAHEMGHNMGAQHDWFVDTETVPATYAHGYVYAPGRWRTIMAYDNQCGAQGFSCPRLLYWASPTHYYNGVAMGVQAGTSTACSLGNVANPPCDADDARLLNETAFTVANFRQGLPAPLAVTALTPSVASPTTVNTTVSWTVTTSGGTGPFTYKFLLFDGANWTVAQDWSASNAWSSWTPAVLGLYSIQVWVRNAGSSALYDAWGQADYTVNGPSPLRVTGLSAVPASTAPVGTAVSWTAMATGGTAPYTYKFFVYDGASWTVGRDWNASNTWSWSPVAAGSYSLQVWVRNAGSGALYDSWLDSGTYVVTPPPSLTVTSLVSTPASSAATNTPVVWSASASGGSAPYTYRFLLWNGSNWSIGQDWSAAATWTWTPSAAGAYSVQVWARNAGSSAVYDGWRGSATFTVTGPAPLSVASLSPSPASAVTGQSVLWNAAVSGGTAPYTFKYLIFNGATWSVGQDWSASSNWSWTPSAAGTYTIQIWARNAGSPNAYDAWRGSSAFTVSNQSPLTVQSLTIGSGAGVVPLGRPLSVAATAAGGIGPYTYKFLVYNGIAWSIGQDWSAAAVWNWMPPSAGTYSVQVWVRNTGSSTAWDAWAGAGPITVASPDR